VRNFTRAIDERASGCLEDVVSVADLTSPDMIRKNSSSFLWMWRGAPKPFGPRIAMAAKRPSVL
jgi:hypothetical protein